MTRPDDQTGALLSDAWLDRRPLLLGTAAAGAGGLLSAIASCPALAVEKRGGILRYGFGDTNPGEKMDPATAANGAGIAVTHIIYQPLGRRGKGWKFSPRRAQAYAVGTNQNGC